MSPLVLNCNTTPYRSFRKVVTVTVFESRSPTEVVPSARECGLFKAIHFNALHLRGVSLRHFSTNDIAEKGDSSPVAAFRKGSQARPEFFFKIFLHIHTHTFEGIVG